MQIKKLKLFCQHTLEVTLNVMGPRKEAIHIALAFAAAQILLVANPAKVESYKIFVTMQLVTLGAMAALIPLMKATDSAYGWTTTLAFILGISLVLRLATLWRNRMEPERNANSDMVRWDTFASTLSLYLFMHALFYLLVPKGNWPSVYLCAFTCALVPALCVVPQLVQMPDVDHEVLVKSLEQTGKANDQGTDTPVEINIYDSKTDTRARVVRRDTDIFISFADTQSKNNLLTNIKILDGQIPDWWLAAASPVPIHVHRGFLEAFETVRERVLAGVRRLADAADAGPTTRIVLCGHSLGGALATLAAVAVSQAHPDLASKLYVYTFGSPQVGDSLFVKLFNSTIPHSVRVVNPLDPIPKSLDLQLVHVKGYWPVTPPKLMTPDEAHALTSYGEGIRQSRITSGIGALLPMSSAALIVTPLALWQAHRTRS